jgi:hypothetical protein
VNSIIIKRACSCRLVLLIQNNTTGPFCINLVVQTENKMGLKKLVTIWSNYWIWCSITGKCTSYSMATGTQPQLPAERSSKQDENRSGNLAEEKQAQAEQVSIHGAISCPALLAWRLTVWTWRWRQCGPPTQNKLCQPTWHHTPRDGHHCHNLKSNTFNDTSSIT